MHQVRRQSLRRASCPVHCTWASHIQGVEYSPLLWLNGSTTALTGSGKRRVRHATMASACPKLALLTEPHLHSA